KVTPSLNMFFALGCFALCQTSQAVSPAPDGGYPGFNTAEGTNSLKSLTTGVANVAVGWDSLFSDTDGSFNTALGAGTLLFNVGDQSAFEGVNNTAIGAASLLFNTTGFNNTAVGAGTLVNNDSSDNTAVGTFALNSNTTGANNTANGAFALFTNGTGINNTAVGLGALEFNDNGNGNTALGWQAGSAVTGSHNICIGTDVTGFAFEDNTIRIGANLPDTPGASACYIGGIRNQSGDPATMTGVGIDATGKLATVASSRRFKRDIQPMDKTSEAILALKPVTFHYKSDKKRTPCFGLIAEEVAKVNKDLVVRDKELKPQTVRYEQVNSMFLNEFLKEHHKVEAQEATIAQLKSVMAQQQNALDLVTRRLEEPAAQIQSVS